MKGQEMQLKLEMRFGLGLCYAVLRVNGEVVAFRYEGVNENGEDVMEIPPGSGKRVESNGVVGAYKASWGNPLSLHRPAQHSK